jgi:hypothetical protein
MVIFEERKQDMSTTFDGFLSTPVFQSSQTALLLVVLRQKNVYRVFRQKVLSQKKRKQHIIIPPIVFQESQRPGVIMIDLRRLLKERRTSILCVQKLDKDETNTSGGRHSFLGSFSVPLDLRHHIIRRPIDFWSKVGLSFRLLKTRKRENKTSLFNRSSFSTPQRPSATSAKSLSIF